MGRNIDQYNSNMYNYKILLHKEDEGEDILFLFQLCLVV